MASYSEWKKKKSGQKYCRIFISRGAGKSQYSEIFDWPMKADGSPVAKSTAESKRDARAKELEHCDKSALLTKSEQKAIDDEAERLAKIEAAKIRTFRQYGEQVFMPAKAITCAEKTRQYYQFALDKHLFPVFGDLPLPEIAPAQLKAFFLEKQKAGLSHSTLLGIYTTANQLFEMAMLDDTIPFNILTKVPRPREKKDDVKRSDPPRFSEQEVKRIKECLKKEPLKWQALVTILMDTGMRRGEVCALTWDKIDFEHMTIRVDGNIGYTPEKGVFREKPKTKAGDRDVPMTPEVANILKRYRAELVETVAKRGARYEKDHKMVEFDSLKEWKKIIDEKKTVSEYLFTVKGWNDPIFPDAVNRYFSRFSKTYKIDDFRPHKLRHTAASIMIENGVPVAVVAAILGHEDASVTHKIYTHASEEGMRAAIDTLAKATSV
jgi:integrase